MGGWCGVGVALVRVGGGGRCGQVGAGGKRSSALPPSTHPHSHTTAHTHSHSHTHNMTHTLASRFSQLPSMQTLGDAETTLGFIFAAVGLGCFVGGCAPPLLLLLLRACVVCVLRAVAEPLGARALTPPHPITLLPTHPPARPPAHPPTPWYRPHLHERARPPPPPPPCVGGGCILLLPLCWFPFNGGVPRHLSSTGIHLCARNRWVEGGRCVRAR